MENFNQYYKQKKADDKERASRLVAALTRAGRQNELFKASANAQYREKLYREFGI